jgi:trans-aconitate methyltransferase
MPRALAAAISLVLAFSVGAQTAVQPAPQKELRAPDVIFVPTPQDVLYDLGSGDGRIPITAAQKYDIARGVGIDINPERVREANENRLKAGVADRVSFLNADLFEADLSDATVITLYLLPALNLKLLPKLLKEVKPGTRIVSHAFDMGTWKPEQTLELGSRSVYFWTIPAPGTPAYEAAMAAAKGT